jgi:hypothetical protein
MCALAYRVVVVVVAAAVAVVVVTITTIMIDFFTQNFVQQESRLF